MIGDSLEINTYEYLLSRALARVSNSYDKRQGSIMWDTLAPHDYQLAEFYMDLRQGYKDTFADTATGEYLELRAKEQGITRIPASKALKRADFTNSDGEPMVVPIGTRFATVSSSNPINYYVESQYFDEDGAVAGAYELRCETEGTIGNEYTGDILNVTFLTNIATAVMSTLLEPARDVETDEELRIRYFLRVSRKAFGGNVAQYDEEIKAIAGVGEVQVYPVWNGGGTVKVSIVDAEYNPVSDEFLRTVEELVDPENADGHKGTGLGIAPIGHNVTIVTPTEAPVTVSATVTVSSGYRIGQVEPVIKEKLEEHFLSLRKEWGVADEFNKYSLFAYVAKINAIILSVDGVANVKNTLLNGSGEDISFTQSAELQQIPKLGEVTISEG